MPGSRLSAATTTPTLVPPVAPAIPHIPSHWRFPADAASVGRARHAVAEVLSSGCRPQLADDLGIVTSELVTNAVRHGARADEEEVIELVLWPADGHYWVAVSDPGATLPAMASRGPEACGGRGLLLVNALSATWAVVPRRACGKSVVAGIRLDSG